MARLKPVCSLELASGGSFEGSPVAYKGVLYVTTTNGTFAVDGRTCAKLWSYQYDATDIAAGANNKGVAIGGGRVIRGTVDGHLIALDIKTGDVLWDRKIMDSSAGASAMAAPLIWNDLVFMPKAGGDVGVRGEFMAFRVSDGTKVWGFSTIPMRNETGANTWRPANAALHGGGGVWTYFTLDPKTGTIFMPVGNPGPDFDSTQRRGANLFTTGIVALDARTGKLRWSYQTEPNDDHDWDATGTALFDTSDGRHVSCRDQQRRHRASARSRERKALNQDRRHDHYEYHGPDHAFRDTLLPRRGRWLGMERGGVGSGSGSRLRELGRLVRNGKAFGGPQHDQHQPAFERQTGEQFRRRHSVTRSDG